MVLFSGTGKETTCCLAYLCLSVALSQAIPFQFVVFPQVFGLIGLNWAVILLHMLLAGATQVAAFSWDLPGAGQSQIGAHSPGPHPAGVSPGIP